MFRLIKSPKHRQFTFHARYYDERKERLEKVAQEAAGKNGISKEKAIRHHEMRERIADSWTRKQYGSHQKQSTMRFLIILGILAAIMYVIYVNLDKILQ